MYFLNTCTELKLKPLNNLRQTSPSFTLYCLFFGSRNKHNNQRNIHLKSESITGQPALELVVMRKLASSSWTVVLVLRTKVFAKTILEHCSQRMFTQTVRILRSGFSMVHFTGAAVVEQSLPLSSQVNNADQHTLRRTDFHSNPMIQQSIQKQLVVRERECSCPCAWNNLPCSIYYHSDT